MTKNFQFKRWLNLWEREEYNLEVYFDKPFGKGDTRSALKGIVAINIGLTVKDLIKEEFESLVDRDFFENIRLEISRKIESVPQLAELIFKVKNISDCNADFIVDMGYKTYTLIYYYEKKELRLIDGKKGGTILKIIS